MRVVCEAWQKSHVLDASISKGNKMTKATVKMDLLLDEDFRDFLIGERAAQLARVDNWERLLGMELTKDLRKEVKRLKHENEKLKQENNSVL